MISKDEAAKAAQQIESGSLSWADLQQEYPKVTMVIDYIIKHYPDDADKISGHQMLPGMIFSDYSNTQIESMIDKLAIFNGWTKYEPRTN